MNGIIIFFIATSSTVFSQICWKISSRQVIQLSDGHSLLLKQFSNIWFIIGWVFYLLATFLWVYLLSKYELSKIYSIYVGTCIIMSLVIGFIFFKENTGMLYKTIGTVLIICGIALITKS
jgi:multidrug transporter EmrE-like cation transporter